MTDPPASADASAGPPDGSRTSEPPAKPAPSTADLAILGYVLGLLVLWAPNLYVGLISPRIALLLVATGPGLVVLAGLARRDVAARWAIAYLAWALLSVVVAPHPRLALLASFGTDVGWVYLVGYVASWALGRRLTAAGRRLLPGVVLAGIVVNALFGVLEAVTDPTVGSLAPQDGRVHGLLSNSLFLGGVLAGGSAMVARRLALAPRRRWWALPVLSLLVLATNLTGSRAALVGGAGLAIVGVGLGRRRHLLDALGPPGQAPPTRIDIRRSVARCVLLVTLAVGIGFAGSLPLQGEASSSSRLTGGSGGYESRTIMWRLGAEALADRPIAGWGPGRFREATAPRVTAAFVRAEGPDKLFYDAHNLLVEHAVTTGVVGLGLLLGFAWAMVRRARGPLAWLAAGIALTWLLNPVSVCTGPLALLALGAACSEGRTRAGGGAVALGGPDGPGHRAPPAVRTGVGRVPQALGIVLALLGLAAGGLLVSADALIDQATSTGRLGPIDGARRLLPADSVLTDLRTKALGVRAEERPSAAASRAVVASAREAVGLDPTRSTFWVTYGYAESEYGVGSVGDRTERARVAFEEALRWSPWSQEAMLGLRAVAGRQGDDRALARWEDRLCQIGTCDLPPLAR